MYNQIGWDSPERVYVYTHTNWTSHRGENRRSRDAAAGVCVPASDTLPNPTLPVLEPRPEATGTYAFVAGKNGPSSGNNATLVKLHNTGVFNYLLPTKLKTITDGLTHTAFVGEIRSGHLPASSNVWSFALRHLDSLRTTEAQLNAIPGLAPYTE